MENKRSQVIIKNEFQQRLILNTVLITLITLNVIIIGAFSLDNMFATKDDLFSVFSISVAVMEVLAVIVVFFIGRKISFHIAGPVYAIERTLKSMNDGNLAQQLRLRSGDHFVEVSDEINDVIDSYRVRITRVQALVDGSDTLAGPELQKLREELAWFKTRAEK